MNLRRASLLVAFDIGPYSNGEPLKITLPIFGSAAVRSMVDYAWCWDFYFPPGDGKRDAQKLVRKSKEYCPV